MSSTFINDRGQGWDVFDHGTLGLQGLSNIGTPKESYDNKYNPAVFCLIPYSKCYKPPELTVDSVRPRFLVLHYLQDLENEYCSPTVCYMDALVNALFDSGSDHPQDWVICAHGDIFKAFMSVLCCRRKRRCLLSFVHVLRVMINSNTEFRNLPLR